MNARVTARAGALALGLAAVAATASPAQASVFSSVPNSALSAFPVTIMLGGPGNSFAFTRAETDSAPAAAVATGGTGKVTTLGGLTDFALGSTIDQTGEVYGFAPFTNPTLIPYSIADDFIGLSFVLADGIHYGYAEVFGPELVSYGYETTPGASILTGATSPVPEPATVTLVAAGLAGLAGVWRRRLRPR